MNKKLIAVAVAGALGVPGVAFAQASTVQIYGTVVTNYNYLDQGAGAVKGDYFNAHDSNFGIKGEEKLGGALSAWFQCETSFDPTLGGDGVCARNSAIGFKGGFGNIFVGNWDTAMKMVHGPARPWSTSGAYGMGSLLWNESGSNVGNGAGNAAGTVVPLPRANGTSFTRRQAQLISYQTPDMGGFKAMFSVSAAAESVEGANGRTILPTTTIAAKPRLWSLGASYTNGPMYLGAGYERHDDYNPAGNSTTYTGGTDRGWLLAAAYTFGTVKLMGIYSDIRYDTAPGASLDNKGFGVYANWRISGPHGMRIGYTQANSASGTAGGANVGSLAAPTAAGTTNSGARLYGIQYYHSLSKRTELNLGYAMLNNDERSRHRLQTLGNRNTCTNVGQAQGCDRDQNSIVLGVRHSF